MKKLLSFVLVLALVLGSFSMVFAADTTKGLSDIAGDANEEAINVVNGLGIVTGYTDGSFKADNAVTRAEFAAMITRALNVPESALAGYTASTFLDTAGYGWAVPYLAFCNTKGIMLGDGNGNAMPGQTITVNQAITMVCRALGYTDNSALLVGSWPANYVTVAQSLDLYKKVDATATVDRGSAAQMIYNALTKATVAVNANGETVGTGSTMLKNLNCKTATTAALGYTEASKIVLNDYIGAAGTEYLDSDNNIIAFEADTTFLTGKFAAGYGTFKADGVTYNVTEASDGAVYSIVNTVRYAETTTIGALGTDEITIAVDVTGKTIEDVVSVIDWDAADDDFEADEDVQDEIADDKTLGGYEFAQTKAKEIDMASFQLIGVDALTDIAEDDVVAVWVRPAYDTIAKIEVGTKSVEGEVTKYTAGSTPKWIIDGTEYKASAYAASTPSAVGDKGTAKLDANGKIYSWSATDETAGNYAVFIGKKATGGEYGSTTTTYSIKFFTGEGETITANVYKNATTAAWNLAAGGLFEYSLNSKGEVKEVTTGAVANSNVSGKISNNGTLFGTEKLAADVVVFVKDGSDWSIEKISNLKTNVTASSIARESSKIVAMVVEDTYVGNTDDVYGIVTASSAKAKNADDELVQLLDVIIDGVASADVYTDAEDKFTGATGATAELQKITKDANGVITGITTASSVTSVGAVTCTAIDGNIITLNGANYALASDVVCYVWNSTDEKWEVKNVTAAKKKAKVKIYDTNTEDGHSGYEVVIVY